MGLCPSPTLRPCLVLIWKIRMWLCCHSCDHSYSVRSGLGKWIQAVKTAENGSLDTSPTTLCFCRGICSGSPINSPQLFRQWDENKSQSMLMAWRLTQPQDHGKEQVSFTNKLSSLLRCFWGHTMWATTTRRVLKQSVSKKPTYFSLFLSQKKHLNTFLHCYKQRALSQHSHRTASAFFFFNESVIYFHYLYWKTAGLPLPVINFQYCRRLSTWFTDYKGNQSTCFSLSMWQTVSSNQGQGSVQQYLL